jgi:hypothetical protein
MNREIRTKVQRGLVLMAVRTAGVLAWNLVRRLQEADLRGQVAVVTGASRGLGFLLARELVLSGCKVAICARDEQDDCIRVVLKPCAPAAQVLSCFPAGGKRSWRRLAEGFDGGGDLI